MERLVIVGPGRIGLSLGAALVEAGAVATLEYRGRHPEPPDHPLFSEGTATWAYGMEVPAKGTTAVLLTVPDRVLGEVAEVLAARGEPPEGTPVLHCSGALGADPLAPLHARGYQVGTLHPLQAIAHPADGPRRLLGASFAVSGEPGALAAARRLVGALGGRALPIPTARRPLYHAAAVLASNYLVVLLRTAARLLEEAGAPPEDAERALVRLARGALENVEERGLQHALTGPVSRGDPEVVGLHLRALSPEDAELYALLGLQALETARPALGVAEAAALEELLQARRPRRFEGEADDGAPDPGSEPSGNRVAGEEESAASDAHPASGG
jgi:predicted short-subunit dehydrogenase-like oxidoreductase (DUF2520 family)